jgi:hypothetical protein
MRRWSEEAVSLDKSPPVPKAKRWQAPLRLTNRLPSLLRATPRTAPPGWQIPFLLTSHQAH